MTAPISAPEAERALLGSILLEPRRWTEVADLVTADDFTSAPERAGWEVVRDLVASGAPVTPVQILPELRRRGAPAGKADIGRWLTAAPLSALALNYAQEIQAAATLRRLDAAAGEIAAEARASRDGLRDPDAALARAEAALWAVRRTAPGAGLRPVAELLPAAVETLEGGGPVPVTTGFRDLDGLLLGGLRPGELTVLAARPSQGKTTVALNIAAAAAVRGVPVVLFSLEMTASAILGNMVLSWAGVRGDRARTGKADPRECDALNAAAAKVHGWPLLVDDQADLDVAVLAARARRAAADGRAGLVIVDYLQSLRGEGRTEYEQVSSISAALKALAKQLAVPVLAVAQLARGSESRDDRRPRMSDLRGSGRIEQDADVILLLHRPGYYEPDKIEMAGVAFLRIAKHRQGPCGVVELRADLPMFRFEDGPVYGPAVDADVPETTRSDLR